MVLWASSDVNGRCAVSVLPVSWPEAGPVNRLVRESRGISLLVAVRGVPADSTAITQLRGGWPDGGAAEVGATDRHFSHNLYPFSVLGCYTI